jgi:hypothetical protein
MRRFEEDLEGLCGQGSMIHLDARCSLISRTYFIEVDFLVYLSLPPDIMISFSTIYTYLCS